MASASGAKPPHVTQILRLMAHERHWPNSVFVYESSRRNQSRSTCFDMRVTNRWPSYRSASCTRALFFSLLSASRGRLPAIGAGPALRRVRAARRGTRARGGRRRSPSGRVRSGHRGGGCPDMRRAAGTNRAAGPIAPSAFPLQSSPSRNPPRAAVPSETTKGPARPANRMEKDAISQGEIRLGASRLR